MKKIEHFMLPEHTNNLYKNEAISSISLTKDIATKINELIDNYNALSVSNLEKVQEQDGKIRKGILYMKDNLINTLNDMMAQLKESGFIDDRIKANLTDLLSEVDTLEARLNNLLGTVTAGTSTMDSEIIDGRIGANNRQYASIGEAIRKNIKMVLGEKVGNVLNLRLSINTTTKLITLERVNAVDLSVLFGEKKRYHFEDAFNSISLNFGSIATSTYNIVFNSTSKTIRLVEVSMLSGVVPEYNYDDFILATLYMSNSEVKEVVFAIENFVYINGSVVTTHIKHSQIIGVSNARIEIDTLNKTISFPNGLLFFDKTSYVEGNATKIVSYAGFVNPAGETIRVVYENGNLAIKKLTDITPDECLLMLIWFGASEMTYKERIFANTVLKDVIYFNGEKLINTNVNSKHYNTFSIIGDSYSTFDGFMTPSTNRSYYPNTNNDVTNVEECWWHLFANEYGSTLINNNSFTGSTISYDGYGTSTTDGKTDSFVTRSANVGNAELIIIFGGTNDSSVGVAQGNYKYSNWSESDFETFRPSLAYVIDNIKKHHAGSKLLFVMNTDLKAEVVTSIETICNYYNVDLLRLSNIEKQDFHPSINGMNQIKNQIISYLNA